MRTARRLLWCGCALAMTGFAKRAAAQDPLAAAKADLRRLVSQNEVYHAKNKRYASDLGAIPGFKPSPGVTVSVGQATATGWSASAATAAAPGKSCVIFVGNVPAPRTQSLGLTGQEAVPVCDK